ncbi:hypothetical protein [Afipia felis]|uniref:Uncharacterized protein n=2 Tax=Afipia felis TaxID=1035 RepID=A0A380W4R6_AFIFE|nr:hypothetical protein [Afipia felis]EKS31079.1 hypothetical protein HMPREF9697_03607 [Afipia felis ATCC 53690]SUU75823.1 Uncharacterised protein [Afipia felis]SUU83890.1 Uncharacterised protein [Afipia felis]
MAVYFFTDQPQALLDKFNIRIRQGEAVGRIHTWIKGSDGSSYTHSDDNWINKSWFKARVDQDALVFNIIRPEDRYVSVKAYAFYHGQIIKTFLNHLDLNFESLALSPRCEDGDINA